MKRILTVILGCTLLAGCSQNSEAMEQSSITTNPIAFTLNEVTLHKSEDDCYTTIEGKVYDITPYIPIHPGGKGDIMKACGGDASSLFGMQHGNNRRAQNQLSQFYIGELSDA